MAPSRRPLTLEPASKWAASAPYQFLDALMADPQIQYEQIAFHGGTSLHFSWRSPRLSEDLDFLIARSAADLGTIVELAGPCRLRSRLRICTALRNPLSISKAF
jgi:hypothetical protein